MDFVLHASQIKSLKSKKSPILTGLAVGDCIIVQWGGYVTQGFKENYKREGVITQITNKFICYRSPSGYCCTVSANHMASGTLVRVEQKALMIA